MNEQQLQNAVIFIRNGARVLANQEADNAKAASLLSAGEETVKLIVELAKPKEVVTEPE